MLLDRRVGETLKLVLAGMALEMALDFLPLNHYIRRRFMVGAGSSGFLRALR